VTKKVRFLAASQKMDVFVWIVTAVLVAFVVHIGRSVIAEPNLSVSRCLFLSATGE
jgi:hypothetical protein